MLKIRRPLGRLIFNMGIAIPGKTVFLIETAILWDVITCACPLYRSASCTHVLIYARQWITPRILIQYVPSIMAWWRHQMETFSALLAICAGNSPVTQRPVTRSFDVFFDLYLNTLLSKQWWGWWFETPSRPLWRHCNGYGDVACAMEATSSVHVDSRDGVTHITAVYWPAHRAGLLRCNFLGQPGSVSKFPPFLWVKLWVGWVGRGYIEISRYFPALWINRVTLVTKIKLWYSLGY